MHHMVQGKDKGLFWRIKAGKDNWDDPDNYILYILKLFLIRSIELYQDLFEPFLSTPIENHYQLRTSLFNELPIDVKIRQWARSEYEHLLWRVRREMLPLEDYTNLVRETEIEKMKANLLDKNWLKKICEKAVSEGFVGTCTFALILALNKQYNNYYYQD